MLKKDILKKVHKLAEGRLKDKNKDKELNTYLESLDYEDVKMIQTVMYLGRDRDYKVEESTQERYENYRMYLDSQGWCGDKYIDINQIVQKGPLNEYLETAFDILNIK